jgi:hypothetical protein
MSELRRAEPLVHDSSPFEVELIIANLRSVITR